MLLTAAEPAERTAKADNPDLAVAENVEPKKEENEYSEIQPDTTNYDHLHPYANTQDDLSAYSPYSKPTDSDVYEIR
jgi:hypothetical protein